LTENIQNQSYPTKRGHFRILIGAAPGVGKTYRMLQEAHLLKSQGKDIVVGYFEPHGRKETQSLLEGLEFIPPQAITYKSISLLEMNTDAILKRAPEIVLVDELAHTNVKGSQRQKRYEDVESILNAGISVISTMNIQHIESLHDVVSKITGIQVNERLPDRILDEADEVVLVDISVEELQQRLKQGKIYSHDKIEQALQHFFKKGNLVSLRELALREVADSVEEKALVDPYVNTTALGIHEKIMVCITPTEDSQRLIRRGFRIADRMSGVLLVLFVQLTSRPLSKTDEILLIKHKALTQELGGEFLVVQAHHIVEAIAKTSDQYKVTQIIVGESPPKKNLFSLFKPELPYQIFQATSNVDVYIVAAEN
jgi:two-component system, OmpR family, sensor histidine kinase KdpD